MRYIIFLIFLFYSVQSFTQSYYTETGAVASFYKNKGHNFGGEYNANIQNKKNVLTGAGTAVLFFKDMKGAYIPVYGRLGYCVPAAGFVFNIHTDAGYGFYKHNEPTGLFADDRLKTKGGFYIAPGISVHGSKKFSPYLDIRYAFYQFKASSYLMNYKNNISAITASVGLCFLYKKNEKLLGY